MDTGAPTIGVLAGTAVQGGYLQGGGSTVSTTATDASGIRSGRVLIDGAPVGAIIAGSCNTVPGVPGAYVTAKPCADRGAGSPIAGVVDLESVGDGVHTLSIRVSDAADNTTDAPPQTITVDQTAPAAPEDLEVTSAAPGELGWDLAPPAAMSWTAPAGQISPVDSSYLESCKDGGSCRTTSTTGLSIDTAALAELLDQGDGVYTVKVSLGDEAGNGHAFDASRASSRTLFVDGAAPAAPTDLTGGGERNAAGFTLSWVLPGAQVAPISVINVRLCPVGAGGCTQQMLPGSSTTAEITLPAPDIDFRASVWARDEAGNENPALVADTLLRYHPDSPVDPPINTPPGTDTTPHHPDEDPAEVAPRAPHAKLTSARFARASRRLTITGTGAAGLDARATARLAIIRRGARGGSSRVLHASRATRIIVDRQGRFTRTIVLSRSTARAILNGRQTTLTLVTRSSARWRAASVKHRLSIAR